MGAGTSQGSLGAASAAAAWVPHVVVEGGPSAWACLGTLEGAAAATVVGGLLQMVVRWEVVAAPLRLPPMEGDTLAARGAVGGVDVLRVVAE